MKILVNGMPKKLNSGKMKNCSNGLKKVVIIFVKLRSPPIYCQK